MKPNAGDPSVFPWGMLPACLKRPKTGDLILGYPTTKGFSRSRVYFAQNAPFQRGGEEERDGVRPGTGHRDEDPDPPAYAKCEAAARSTSASAATTFCSIRSYLRRCIPLGRG